MITRFGCSITLVLLATLAACSRERAAVPPPAPAPSPVVAARPPMPEGGYPGMAIPAKLPDGGWPTPNRALTPTAAVWHLRAALNVAALACRGEGETVVTAYNALLTTRRGALAEAETRYAAEWQASGAADWRDQYDDTMTRLYNFYSQPFVNSGFCAAAGTVLTDLAAVPDAQLATFAAARLPELDRPFTDFFTAYDAWRSGGAPPQPPQQPPRLEVDPIIYRLP